MRHFRYRASKTYQAFIASQGVNPKPHSDVYLRADTFFIVPHGYSKAKSATLTYVDRIYSIPSSVNDAELGKLVKEAMQYSRQWILDDTNLPSQKQWEAKLYEKAAVENEKDFSFGLKETVLWFELKRLRIWPIEIRYEDAKKRRIYSGYIRQPNSNNTYVSSSIAMTRNAKVGGAVRAALEQSTNSVN